MFYVNKDEFIVIDKESHDKSGSRVDVSRMEVMGWDEAKNYTPGNKPKSKPEIESIEKQWRDSELSIYVDHFQKPLVWADLTTEEQSKVADYRRLLLDYPASEEFKTQTRPGRPDVPLLK